VLLLRWHGLEGWSLPGGFVGMDEPLDRAAERVLREDGARADLPAAVPRLRRHGSPRGRHHPGVPGVRRRGAARPLAPATSGLGGVRRARGFRAGDADAQRALGRVPVVDPQRLSDAVVRSSGDRRACAGRAACAARHDADRVEPVARDVRDAGAAASLRDGARPFARPAQLPAADARSRSREASARDATACGARGPAGSPVPLGTERGGRTTLTARRRRWLAGFSHPTRA
jgi:hypothetical protein